MLQLDFFPRTELKTLSDFQSLECSQLSWVDRLQLINYPDFFKSPKINDVIRKQHSGHIDKILGFKLEEVEHALMLKARGLDPAGTHESWGPAMHAGVQTWVGLDLQILQTPYSEIMRILQLIKLKPQQHVVDLGAAYGRMGVVIGGLYGKSQFTGFEYVKERVDEGNRVFRDLSLKNVKLEAADLFSRDFRLPQADVYFIYDYGHVEHIDHTLKQLALMARKQPIKVVARGKFTKQIIASYHPWLELKYEGKLEEFFSVYSPLQTKDSASSQNPKFLF